MSLRSRVARWLGRAPAPRPDVLPDPIAERLHAAVDANAEAKAANHRCYESRVHAMIDELFLRMDRDARPHS